MDLQTAYDLYGQKTIKACVIKFRRMFGGDPDDLLSEAQWCFVKAVQTWNPNRGPLQSRIGHCVWWGLFEVWRQNVSRDMKLHRIDTDSLDSIPSRQSDFWEELQETDDAATFADLAINARDRINTSKGKSASETLIDLGWKPERVFQAVSALKEILK